MPFEESKDPLDPNPDVRIFFDGLVLLTPVLADGINQCHVRGVKPQHHSSEHELFVEVSIDEPQPTQPFLRIGNKVLQHDLKIYTDAPAGVQKYVPNGTPSAAPFAFAEAIDFKKLNSNVKLKENGLHHAIRITDGILYTVTHRDSDVSIVSDNTACQDLAAVSLILGANVVLNGRKLVLDWGEKPLELSQDQNGLPKYIIWISNSRTIPPETDPFDFDMFYDGLDGFDPGDKFRLRFKKCGAKEPEIARHDRIIFTTPRIPCIPGVVDG